MYYIIKAIINGSVQTGEWEEIIAFIIGVGLIALGCALLLLLADKGDKKAIKKEPVKTDSLL